MEFVICPPEELVEILDQRTGLIGLLRQVSPTSERFNEHYLAPIVDFAAQIQSLPASPDHHADPGGLLRHGVQAAYYAMRLADGAVFGGTFSAEERRTIGRDSKRAAFLAALVSPIGLPHRYLSICSVDGEYWTETSLVPLFLWASDRRGKYLVKWLRQPTDHVRTLAAWLGGNLLSRHWLGMRHDVMVTAMASIAPEDKSIGQEGPLQILVRQALIKSVETAKRAAACSYVPPDVGIPTLDQIESAIRVPDRSGAGSSVTTNMRPVHGMEVERADLPTQQLLELPELGSSAKPLSTVSPAIRELIGMLAEDIRKDDRVRARVKWDGAEKGLLIDPRLFEKYGMTGTGVASALKKAKLAFDSGNSRSLLLVESIGEILMPRGGR